MSASVIIATTIAPGKIELQQAAIASWQKLGFRVLSVNTSSEIESMQDSFSSVQFVEAKRDASTIAGKPFIYFDDILQALMESESDVCGIVNSDIHLITCDAFIDFIVESAQDSFVFGGRVDIVSLNDLQGEEYFGGFDIFFFDRSVIRLFPQSDMCLGVPWWDYWAPLVMMLRGITVKQLISPVAYHLLHDATWNLKTYDEFGRKLIAGVLNDNQFSELDNDLEDALNKSIAQYDLGAFSMYLLYYIKQKTDKISFIYGEEVTKPQFMTTDGFIELHEKLSFYETQFRQMRQILTERENDRAEKTNIILKERSELAALEKKLSAITESFPWKIAKPFRWLYKRFNRAPHTADF